MIERELDREDCQNQALQYQKNINEVIIYEDALYAPVVYADKKRPFRLTRQRLPTIATRPSSRSSRCSQSPPISPTKKRSSLAQQWTYSRSPTPPTKRVWFWDTNKLIAFQVLITKNLQEGIQFLEIFPLIGFSHIHANICIIYGLMQYIYTYIPTWAHILYLNLLPFRLLGIQIQMRLSLLLCVFCRIALYLLLFAIKSLNIRIIQINLKYLYFFFSCYFSVHGFIYIFLTFKFSLLLNLCFYYLVL